MNLKEKERIDMENACMEYYANGDVGIIKRKYGTTKYCDYIHRHTARQIYGENTHVGSEVPVDILPFLDRLSEFFLPNKKVVKTVVRRFRKKFYIES